MHPVLRSARRALLCTTLIAAIAAPAASAAPVTVNLRVEGPTSTIFEGPITTDAHDVTTAKAGTRPCDGALVPENNGAGPTATGALDDAARLAGFTWDGTYDSTFNDFLIDRVAGDTINPATHYWSLYVGSVFANYGGCGQRVRTGDDVLWGYSDFATSQALRLAGPTTATTGQPVAVQVTNGTGAPQADATVNGATTGPDGRASLTFAQAGVYRLKAEKALSIRSNGISVCVDNAGAEPCTSGDKAPPVASVNLPKGFASASSTSRTITLSWQAQDPAGSGVSTYTVDVRELAGGARASQAGDWRTLQSRSPQTSVTFRGGAGKSYEFRVTAFDRAANQSTPAVGTVGFPVDDRNRRMWRLSKGWRGVKSAQAYGGRSIRPKREGASARLSFTGTSVTLIGRTLPKGGRLAITIDGKRTTKRLRGGSAYRQTLWTSPKLAAGRHVLRVEALGGGPVELDAVAPLS